MDFLAIAASDMVQKRELLPPAISLGELCSRDLPAPAWHLYGLIPESSLVFFAGAPGSYKTFFALKAAYALATGAPLYDRVCENGTQVETKPSGTSVLFVEEEMNIVLIQARMKMFALGRSISPPPGGGEMDPPLRFILSGGVKLTDEAKMAELVTVVKTHNVKVIFMDPLSSVLGAQDENDNAEVSTTLDLVRRTLVDSELGVSVVFIHHPAKNAKGNVSSLRGAGDLLGKCDHAITFERSEVMPQTTVSVLKSRLVDTGELPIVTVGFEKVVDLGSIGPLESWSENKMMMNAVASVSGREAVESRARELDGKEGEVRERIVEYLRSFGGSGATQQQTYTALGMARTGTFLRSWRALVLEGLVIRDARTNTFVCPKPLEEEKK